MKAIKTRTIGWTNTKPTRIFAQAEGLAKTSASKSDIEDSFIRAGDPCNLEDIHHEAAERYRIACGWHDCTLVTGQLDADTFVHVLLPKTHGPGLVVEQARIVVKRRGCVDCSPEYLFSTLKAALDTCKP